MLWLKIKKNRSVYNKESSFSPDRKPLVYFPKQPLVTGSSCNSFGHCPSIGLSEKS